MQRINLRGLNRLQMYNHSMLNPTRYNSVSRLLRCSSSSAWTEVLNRKAVFKPDETVLKIGCASGFWGDTNTAAPQLVEKGNLDFLVFDYLSEITMSLLTAAKNKVPEFGFATDFVQFAMLPLLPDIKRKGIRVISNAGGVNPHACAAALKKACQKASVDLKIAVVTGDDLMPAMEKLKGRSLQGNFQSANQLPATTNSMNAYFGAGPIVKALQHGADIVITGRCTDSALALAPLMHTFNWDKSSHDLLAAGSLAGHLIECGAQVTGGIFTDWHTVPDWHAMGFPIVECSADGRFLVTKPPNTGGVVSKATVSEQLVYEIGDPRNYILPDVCCDFSNVHLTQVSNGDRSGILVSNVKGKAPTNDYKVSATFLDGYRSTAVAPVIGPHAVQKAESVAESILARCKGLFKILGFTDFKKELVQTLGGESNYGPHASLTSPFGGPREVVLWLAVQHDKKAALEIFAREIAPAGTGMAPGLTNMVGGRPKVSPVLKLFSFLYPKSEMEATVFVDDKAVDTYNWTDVEDSSSDGSQESIPNELPPKRLKKIRGTCSFPLGALAYTRSGDKGDNANIGVICRNPGYYPFLSEVLTPKAIQKYFRHVFENDNDVKVHRYDLPGIYAFNFVLENSLGGGGVASLRSDPQGKGYGQILLDFKVKDVPDLLPSTVERMGDAFDS